jgi:uncharacterized lipoprotein
MKILLLAILILSGCSHAPVTKQEAHDWCINYNTPNNHLKWPPYFSRTYEECMKDYNF